MPEQDGPASVKSAIGAAAGLNPGQTGRVPASSIACTNANTSGPGAWAATGIPASLSTGPRHTRAAVRASSFAQGSTRPERRYQ